jgi:hypothetical protein
MFFEFEVSRMIGNPTFRLLKSHNESMRRQGGFRRSQSAFAFLLPNRSYGLTSRHLPAD